jgi:hypothetical protein
MQALIVLGPLLAMALLTFVLMFGMVLTRRRAVMDKKVDPKDLLVRGGKSPWPAQVAQFGDAYQNSLELPILFYAVVILAFITRQADIIFVVLAWVFVIFRAAQAYVHTTTNTRKYRSYAFRGGGLTLLVIWVWFAIRLITA